MDPALEALANTAFCIEGLHAPGSRFTLSGLCRLCGEEMFRHEIDALAIRAQVEGRQDKIALLADDDRDKALEHLRTAHHLGRAAG